jgi:hypothetical protein
MIQDLEKCLHQNHLVSLIVGLLFSLQKRINYLRSEHTFFKIEKVYDGWVKDCDNYVFVAKLDLNRSSELYLSSKFSFLQPADLVNDTYAELSLKMFVTLRDTFAKHDQYDWYLKADQDTFVFMDHLKMFLKDKKPAEPVTYGHDFHYHKIDKGYPSGGAGYVLSNKALKKIHHELARNLSFCEATLQQDVMLEDVDVARCLRRLNVNPGEVVRVIHKLS